MGTSLPFQITVCGIGELGAYRQARVSHVLSILDPGMPVPQDLLAFGEHERLELRFHDIIDERPDMLCPGQQHVETLLEFIDEMLEAPSSDKHLLVHCLAGYSRSSAAAILALAKLRPELPGSDLIAELLRLRERVWPNLRVIELGDQLLGRGGEMVLAVRGLYGELLQRDPELRQMIHEVGRGREVAMALPPQGD